MEHGKKERFELFLATLAGVHDAQSTFLSAEESSGFQQAMTSTFVGVGITLMRDGARLRVEELEPGGPAALSAAIAPGDELLQVSGADDVPVPVLGMSVEDVVKLLRGPVGATVTLYLRTATGAVGTVPLQRALIHPDAGRAQAHRFVSKGSSFGLITLPRFYTDLSSGDGPRCSVDVPLLLDSLTQAGIGGLVIDLRNNQGGSMSETIKLLGLFLDAGPVAQRLARDGSIRVLSTDAPKARYRGPLVVLVNERSASASEFFSAALQDHHRAVIMGTPHTYGKGSIQTLVDLPPTVGADGDTLPAGTAKLTVGLFFRPSGKSVQRVGVTPDIVVADAHSVEPTDERALSFALTHPGIAAAAFTPWTTDLPVPSKVMDHAIARSKAPLPAGQAQPDLIAAVRAPWSKQEASSKARSNDDGMAHALLLLQELGTATRP